MGEKIRKLKNKGKINIEISKIARNIFIYLSIFFIFIAV